MPATEILYVLSGPWQDFPLNKFKKSSPPSVAGILVENRARHPPWQAFWDSLPRKPGLTVNDKLGPASYACSR